MLHVPFFYTDTTPLHEAFDVLLCYVQQSEVFLFKREQANRKIKEIICKLTTRTLRRGIKSSKNQIYFPSVFFWRVCSTGSLRRLSKIICRAIMKIPMNGLSIFKLPLLGLICSKRSVTGRFFEIKQNTIPQSPSDL